MNHWMIEWLNKANLGKHDDHVKNLSKDYSRQMPIKRIICVKIEATNTQQENLKKLKRSQSSLTSDTVTVVTTLN